MPQRKFAGRPPRLERVFPCGDAAPVWFVTFNSNHRRRWLACAPVHEEFQRFAARALTNSQIAVGRYVIMPDHVHLFVSSHDFHLGRWVGLLKQALGKIAPHPVIDGSHWQEGFFDHLLRNDESYSRKWEYVRANPVRAGLVDRWENWPWQGEIVRIDRT